MKHLSSPTKRALGAALLTVLLLCLIYTAFGLFPFGPNTLSWGDMSQQTVPLLMQFKDVLAGRSGLFLNLQNAGGMSFWGVLFFFLASPFHLLVVFVEKADVYFLVNVLVLLKLALAAWTASRFFSWESPGLARTAHLALCLGYSLCGYALLYYQNLVWLDVLALFPLVMLGFLRLVQGGGGGLFTAALAWTVAVNYYLSYMVLLGVLLCAGVFLLMVVPGRSRRRFAGRVGLSALTALGLTAVVWLPSLLQCLDSARTGSGTAGSVGTGDFLPRLTTTLPMLLCTAAAAGAPLLALIFPMDRKARAVAVCWGLTILPLLADPVNKLWHMGSYQAFPARYGYMPVFFGLWFLARGLDAPARQSKRSKGPIFLLPALGLSGLAGIWLLWAHFQEISSYTSTLWVDETAFRLFAIFWLAALLAVVLACLCQARWGMAPSRCGCALLAVAIMQGLCQSAVFVGSAANVPAAAVVELSPPEEPGLYRVKPQEKICPVNLIGAAGLPTFSHYTSLTGQRFLPAIKKMGYSTYWMESTGSGGTKLSDALLSIRYALTADLTWASAGNENLGLLVPAGSLPEELPIGDRLELQSRLFTALTGNENPAFHPYAPAEGTIEETGGKYRLKAGIYRWEIDVEGPETLYFDAFDQVSTRLREAINDCFQVTVNGRELPPYPSQRSNGILELGEVQNQRVTVEVRAAWDAELASFGVWGLRETAVEELTGALGETSFQFEGGRLSGRADAAGGQALFLSVPWYQGMRVAVNGVEVRPRLVLECFMEIPLPEGPCEITVRCVPAGFPSGLLLSTLTLLALALNPLLRLTPAREAALRLWLRAAPVLLRMALAAALLLVYLLPPVLWAAARGPG